MLTPEQDAALKVKAIELGAGLMKGIADQAGDLLAKETAVSEMLKDRTVHFAELQLRIAVEADASVKADLQSDLDDTHQTIVNETQVLIQDAKTASSGWLKSVVDLVLGTAKSLLPVALPLIPGGSILAPLLSKLG